jgi:hypothetical protein
LPLNSAIADLVAGLLAAIVYLVAGLLAAIVDLVAGLLAAIVYLVAGLLAAIVDLMAGLLAAVVTFLFLNYEQSSKYFIPLKGVLCLSIEKPSSRYKYPPLATMPLYNSWATLA